MNDSRLAWDRRLGTHHENTVDALKKNLGVDHLELVVLDSVDEYRELLVEVPPPRRQRVPLLLVTTALIVLLFALAYLGDLDLHP